MKSREAMARRYCIIRRENPDDIFEGEPVWKHGAREIDAVFLMLDSFGIKDPTAGLFLGRAMSDQLTMKFDEDRSNVRQFGRN